MILISGAGGKTGRAVLKALLHDSRDEAIEVRLFLRRETHLPNRVTGYVGDMTRAADWAAATAGVDRIYHICPNMHPEEVEMGRLALAAGRRVGVSHFVFHSVLHPQTEKMPHHWRKMLVEEMVLESGLPFTILQPTAYIQNIRAAWEQIVDTGVYRVPYPVNTRISLVDLAEVAEVAAAVLLGDTHMGATYELVGTEALTQVAVAAHLEAALGRPVRAEAIRPATWELEARQAGVPEPAIASLLAMFRYYAAYGLVGNRSVLRWLLGREPAGVVEWARGRTK